MALCTISAPVLVAFLHCSAPSKRAETAGAIPAARAEAGVAVETGAGGAGEPIKEPPRPDPAIVEKALDRTGAGDPSDDDALGLRFEVVELGPDALWAMAVVNRGTEPVRVVFDPRLLVLEIEPPPDPKAKKWTPKPKLRVCRLPDELRPLRAEEHYVLRLEPGKGMVEAFDVRLYCLPEKGVSPLVAGARVTARFGWAPKTKTVWRKGKREEELLPQTPPFVAELALPPDEPDEDGGSSEDAGAVDAAGDAVSLASRDGEEEDDAELAVKELRGTSFVLGSDYGRPSSPPPEPLALELRSGSDAKDETRAMVTLALVNRSKEPRRVYFRREFVSFQVSGPDGVVTCDPQPDTRAPDRQAFTLLAPTRSLTVTSRLIELCPDDTFSRPGLYVVRAQLDTFASGDEFGFDAFVGHLVAPEPVVVRIRSGTLPFPGTRVLEEVRVGAP